MFFSNQKAHILGISHCNVWLPKGGASSYVQSTASSTWWGSNLQQDNIGNTSSLLVGQFSWS